MATFDKTARSENASQRLRKHLQGSKFLIKIKTKIEENPHEDYRTIIQDNIKEIPEDGYVLTLAVLTEWNKAETMDDLRKNETWKLVQKPSAEKTPSKSPEKLGPTTPASSENILQKNKTEKTAREKQAKERRSAATRRVRANPKNPQQLKAVQILRQSREGYVPLQNTARYSQDVRVSATHKLGKNGHGGGHNQRRRTAKNHRKPQK
jgi:hypothetical protein